MDRNKSWLDARTGSQVAALAAGWLVLGTPAVPVRAAAHLATEGRFGPIASDVADRLPMPGASSRVVLEQRSRGGGGSGGQAVPRGGSGTGGGSTGGGSTGGGSTGSGGSTTRSGGGSSGGTSSGGGSQVRSGSGSGSGSDTAGSRPREGRPATGQAVERPGGPGGPGGPPPGGGYWGGYYPWGWGGLGFGAYYGGYYDPWWYGGYPAGGYAYGTEGAVRLKVKPREAEVLVDGYFAGSVDDYDGMFQKLHLDPGPHRVEIRLDGYEALMFEVRIQPGKTINYKGAMLKLTTP